MKEGESAQVKEILEGTQVRDARVDAVPGQVADLTGEKESQNKKKNNKKVR
jgi:hypothetical protein